MNNRKVAWGTGGVVVIIVLALLALCTVCIVGGGAAWLLLGPRMPSPRDPVATVMPWPDVERPEDAPVNPAPGATPLPPAVAPPPDEAAETLEALEGAEIPDADLHDLAVRFLGVPEDTPRVAPAADTDLPVGTVRTFQASNLDADETFELEARLAYKTEHVYMWVEEGLNVRQGDIEDAAELFESHTYPTNREFFGSEWTPGVDGDPHLNILHARNLGSTVAGYFSSADAYVTEVRSDSNEMEMFYIHIDRGMDVGDPFYNGVLAHEFQHMIHWNNDRNETTWLNEGCSELAMELNNRTYPGGPGLYDVGGSEYAYLDRPDTQLNTWPEVDATGSAAAHYGASYLFMAYFLDRFGDEATQSLVAHEENGLESVDAVLAELGLDLTHQELFADWVAANLLDTPELDAEGRFGYDEIEVGAPRVDRSFGRSARYPEQHRSEVAQYGVDYIAIEGREPLTFEFTGETQARLMDTDAYSGKYLWWSNRADESNPRLSRVLDLTEATTAELDFWAWHHIEEDWDYAYVTVGTTEDGTLPADINDLSINWEILDDAGLTCTTTNPNNGNLGCGITGRSTGWQRLTADLTPYVGREIVLRFEYVTDAAVNQAGLAIDDITVTVDGTPVVQDDVEAGEGDWIAEGFVRHANVLPQPWLVQLITLGDTPTVERLLLGEEHSGTWEIPLGDDATRAVIAISALAPATTEAATYEYTLSAGE